jgi:adenylylsulfate kinase
MGLIPHFTGIDSPYEAPLRPEIHLDTESVGVTDCVKAVTTFLAQRSRSYLMKAASEAQGAWRSALP